MADEGPPGPFMVIKYMTEVTGNETKQHRTTRIMLACGRAKDIVVEYDRELAATDRAGASIALSTRAGDFVLPPSRSKPIVGYNQIEMENRLARVPFGFFEDAAAGDTIDMLEAPDASAPDRLKAPLKLSTAGLSSSIAALRQHCR